MRPGSHLLAWLVAVALALSAAASAGCQSQDAPPKAATHRAPVELSGSVDKTAPKVGEIVTYTLTVDRAEDVQLEVPDVGAQMRGLSITDIEDSPPERRDGRVVTSRKYHLRVDLPGSYQIPEVRVSYPDEDGSAASAIAPAIFIDVPSAGDDAEAPSLNDIKPPRPLPPREIPWIPLGVGAVVLAALGYLIYRLSTREALAPPAPPLPPWVRAEAELEALDARGLLAAGDYRTYFFELSEILRRYMERRFNVPALEQTTDEVLHLFRKGHPLAGRLPRDQEDRVRRFLNGADQIKFAKHEPAQGDVDGLRQDCRQFVVETTPVAPPPVEGDGEARP